MAMKFDRGNLLLTVMVLVLLSGILGPWFVWGEKFNRALTLEGSINWLRVQGGWAWLAGVGLLVGDLVLPVPSTIVMSALGVIYGAFVGGLLAGAGSLMGGIAGYWLSRLVGRPMAVWLVGEEAFCRTETLFARGGSWLVLTSRWLPVFPEAVSCLAGLARMPFKTFLAASATGSLPMGFAFAGIGALAQERQGLAMGLSIILPVLSWLIGRRLIRC
jgi:uncharacterized membrane protein YdjX (TVP38/TMEM64 family)